MEKLSLIQEYNLYKISDLKKQIDNFGIPLEFTIYGDKCYFYNSDLYGLFELKIEKEGIKPLDFIKYYKEGFLNGLRHLEDKEQIFERDFSDTNRRHLSIQLIKDILHSREFIEHTKGLINLIRKVSLIFTEKTIYDQGYYNGLFYSIDNLIKKKGITYEDVQPEITIDQTIKDEGHYEFKFDQNEQAFEEFIANKLSNRENIYYDKFDFDYNNETFEEFKEKFDSYRSEFNFSDLKAECNRYQNIYEVCEYKLNGKNYKEKLPDEYYKEIEIHSEFFNITNYSKTYNLSNSIILFLEQYIKSSQFNSLVTEIPKLNNQLNIKPIIFSHPEIREKLFNELKNHFEGKEIEFKKVLEGNHIEEKLFFPSNQNKFVEVFKRLKYNKFLVNTPSEIKIWICTNFCFKYTKGTKTEIKDFNLSTVHDILTKDRGEPSNKERICVTEWLPYKSYSLRKYEI